MHALKICDRFTKFCSSYSYDPLNRITSAIDDTSDNRYSLTNIEYDRNGNIQKLKRNGHTNNGATSFGVMDDLTYSYTGNQLKAVDDDIASSATQGFVDGAELTTEYTYDINGNLLTDLNKGITDIDYNYYDLPIKVTVNNPQNNGTIDYVYAANGTKLRKSVFEGGITTITDYAGNYIYENNKLQFFSTTEGTVSPKNIDDYSQGFDYVYNYVDHLGNIRLSYTDANGDGNITTNEIVKESNYYPFGLAHKGYNNNVSPLGNSSAKRYMFGGKESQDELGLGWYDVTARNYDPALGRWMNLDPLAEQMRRHSPYNYAFDNPVYFQDYDGMAPCPPGVDCGGLAGAFKRFFGIKESTSVPKQNNNKTSSKNRDRLAKIRQAVKGGGANFTSDTGKVSIVRPESTRDNIPTFNVTVLTDLLVTDKKFQKGPKMGKTAPGNNLPQPEEDNSDSTIDNSESNESTSTENDSISYDFIDYEVGGLMYEQPRGPKFVESNKTVRTENIARKDSAKVAENEAKKKAKYLKEKDSVFNSN